jgi:hypothetical protein
MVGCANALLEAGGGGMAIVNRGEILEKSNSPSVEFFRYILGKRWGAG